MQSRNIYILSTGRTGSTFLANLFVNSNIDIELGHQQFGSRIINIIGNLPTENSHYLKLLLFLFNIFNRGGSTPYSTVDPLVSLSLYKLIKNNKIEGDYKIVHLIRDPRTFVTSFMNWKRQSFKRKILHYLIPFWNPVPVFHGVSFFKFITMSKFEKFCWVWSFKNRLFLNLNKDRNHYYLLRMEDILFSDKKDEVFEQLLCFLNHDLNQFGNLNVHEKVNISKKSFPLFKDWDNRKKNLLSKHCSHLMSYFNYSI